MGGERGPVICEVLEKSSDYDIRDKKGVRFVSEYGILIFQGATDSVNVYDKNGKRNGTIKLPAVCLSFDVVSTQGFCVLLCGLEDGRIISVSLQQWCHQTRKKKKKHKSKDKKNLPEDQILAVKKGNRCLQTNEPLEQRDGEVGRRGGGDDIFADLLAGGDDVNLGCGDGDDELLVNQMQEFYATLGEVTVIDRPHVVLETQDLDGFVVVSDSLVTCCREGHGWRISVYHCSVNPANTSLVSCEKTPSFSTVIFGSDELPDISSSSSSSKKAARSQDLLVITDLYEHAEEEVEKSQTASIYGVTSSSSHDNQLSLLQSASLLVLSDVLFDALWGSAANLVDCPVVLVTLPDGCVYSILVKNLCVSSNMAKRGQRVRLLYQSVQPTIQVSTLALSSQLPDTSRTSSDCLVLVGSSGQVVSLNADAANAEAAKTTMHYVRGPIRTAMGVRHNVVCASDFDINLLTFHLTHEGAIQTQVQCFQVTGISSLACVKSNSSWHKFLAFKKDGTLLHLSLPADQSASVHHSAISSSAAGQQIKELLHAIQEVSSRMALLTDVAIRQSTILKELGKAHHVVCHVAEHTGAFGLTVRVECCHENGLRQVKVVCEVTNATHWTLSQGWTLVSSLSGNIVQAANSGCCRYHKTVSILLVNFAPKATETSSFVLDGGSQILDFPLEVNCSLHFDLSSFREKLQKNGCCNFDEADVILSDNCQSVVFTVGSQTLDILDALQFSHDSVSQYQQKQRKPHSDWKKKVFPEAYGAMETNRMQSSSASNSSCSVSISFNKSLLATLPEDSKHNLSERLLILLLHGNRLKEVKGQCVEASTPNGCLVSIQAADSSDAQMKLQITASEERVTRRLTQAIHRRLKSFKLVSAPLSTDVEGVHKEIRVAKNQHERLQKIQDQLAVGSSNKDLIHVAREVMDLHSNLRSQLTIH